MYSTNDELIYCRCGTGHCFHSLASNAKPIYMDVLDIIRFRDGHCNAAVTEVANAPDTVFTRGKLKS